MRQSFVLVTLASYLFVTGCASLGLDNDWVEDPQEDQKVVRNMEWSPRKEKPVSYKTQKSKPKQKPYSRLQYQEPYPSKMVQRAWTDKYLGKKGYLVRPPLFSNDKEARKFQRCKPIEIVGFEQQKKKGQYILIAQQGNKTLRITSVDRKGLKLNTDKEMTQLEHHFVGRLHFLDQKRHRASVGQNLCVGRLWKHMPKDFFLFISGKPDEVRPGRGPYKGVEQWVYKSRVGRKEQSYYFSNGSLWAWTD